MDQDTVASLYDFPAREYGTQGRWPSPDPAGLAAVDPTNPQSWNGYSYVLNSPLSLVDPLGLHWEQVCATVGAGTPNCSLVWVPDDPGHFPVDVPGICMIVQRDGMEISNSCRSSEPPPFDRRDHDRSGNTSGGAAGNQGPSFFDKFAACTEANRLDNALRGLGQAYGHPDLGNAAANLTNTATGAAIANQALNLTASALIPVAFRGGVYSGFHSTSWPHFVGGLLSQATGESVFSTIGKVAGRGLSAVAAVTIVAEGAYNGAAMARCGVVTALGNP